MQPLSLFPLGDHSLKPLIDEFGGWQKVLDPDQSVPDELYARLDEAGYSKKQIDNLRVKFGQPERTAWITTIGGERLTKYWVDGRVPSVLDTPESTQEFAGKTIHRIIGSYTNQSCFASP